MLSYVPSIPLLVASYLLGVSVAHKKFWKNFPVSIDNLPTIVIFIIKRYMKMKEETKRKISLTLKGRKKSANHKKRIAQAMKRVRRTREHNKAISEAMKIIWKKRKEETQ